LCDIRFGSLCQKALPNPLKINDRVAACKTGAFEALYSSMDPLSLTASIITVIELSGAVVRICYNFRKSVKGASGEAAKITKELNALHNVLEQLLEFAESEERAGTSRLDP